jgi:aminoglycoside 3-N-acetyltransferase
MTSAAPASLGSLVEQLSALGVAYGGTVLVHASMRAVGPIDGGVATLVSSLRQAVGPRGSIVAPTQTSNNSTTSPTFRAATQGLDRAGLARYVARIEGFDPATTPSFGMGALAEHIRRDPDAVRSDHPQTSFAAVGPDAKDLMSVHDLDCHLGERSPLGALYEADATVLLLGVGYRACTAFHLAEYRLPHQPIRAYCCFVREGGERRQREFKALDLNDQDFDALGTAFEASDTAAVLHGRVGRASARCMQIRQSVDFAVSWMAQHR